jgi:Fusaric acid resistance protein family
LQGAMLADLLGTVAHYTVLTSTGDFLLLASVVLPISFLAAVGRADTRVTSAGGFGIVVFSALQPLNFMDYDLASSLNGVLANLLGVATAVLAFAALPPPASPATRRARARRRIGRAVRTVATCPAILLPHPGRWCAPMFERAALLTPEGATSVAQAHTLMLIGLLLLIMRRDDKALGKQAGRIIIKGGPGLAERLGQLQTHGGSEGVERRRLMALAALLEPGLPPKFPDLSPQVAA